MRRKILLVLLTGLSLAGLSAMHYGHGSFTHDSFAYLTTAEHFLGQGGTADVRRISLFTFVLMPFTGHIILLYLFLAGAALAAFLIISRVVDHFEPENDSYWLFFIVPSYMTYILTSILQESLALLFLSLTIWSILKKKTVLAALFLALGIFTRPAMLAFGPGLVLAYVFYRNLHPEVGDGRAMAKALSQKKRIMLRDGVIFILLILVFSAACSALLLLLSPDPFIAFKALSGRYIRDSVMRWGYPTLWVGLFGALLSPGVMYSFYLLFKKRRAAFIFFGLVFVPYLLGVWYQADIRYVIYLVIPIAAGFSLIPLERWKPAFKAGLLLAFIASCLYPAGPVTYHFDYVRFERVFGLSAKPYIYFDSEYKGRQYATLCRLMRQGELTPQEKQLLDIYRETPILDYLARHVCPDKKNPRP